ncbi:MAG: hypothetical protein IPN42_00355 [Methylococcaceae bacterium]|nr:hypothetical protein [Methylococcaceae bacterium]
MKVSKFMLSKFFFILLISGCSTVDSKITKENSNDLASYNELRKKTINDSVQSVFKTFREDGEPGVIKSYKIAILINLGKAKL